MATWIPLALQTLPQLRLAELLRAVLNFAPNCLTPIAPRPPAVGPATLSIFRHIQSLEQ